jgi:hypothetical protein
VQNGFSALRIEGFTTGDRGSGMDRPKSEARNQKSEGKPKSEIRNWKFKRGRSVVQFGFVNFEPFRGQSCFFSLPSMLFCGCMIRPYRAWEIIVGGVFLGLRFAPTQA